MDELGLRIAVNLAEFVGLLTFGGFLVWISFLRLSSWPQGGPESRFRLTVRGSLILVAWAGLAMGAFRWFEVNFATVYAPGYDEGRFACVRVGMTRAEVESIMGPPLRRDATSPRWSSCENWIYSDPSPPGRINDNYWRRWVLFDCEANGDVVAIVSDYYVD